jgi:aryl-alcohol dehydrogenase-like predicted oxidoreductase
MEYRLLGRTGIRVSSVCLGTMTFGEQNTEAEAHAQLSYALDHGVNFVDTAEMYPVPPGGATQGRTEAYIGTWLKATGARDKIVLASKVAGPSRGMTHIRGGDTALNRTNIRAALEMSLERLRTDYVDLYQLHWPDRRTNAFGQLGYRHDPQDRPVPIEETLEALAELVTEGKIRAIGLSNETPWGVAQFLALAETKGLPRVASIQNPYNFLNRTYEIGLAEFSHREDCGLLAYSPLAMGVLSGKYLNGAQPAGARLTLFTRFQRYKNGPSALKATEAYVDLAKRHGLDPSLMALAFVTHQPFVTANIIGATTMAQLAFDISACQAALPAPVLEGIEAIHAEYSNPCP